MFRSLLALLLVLVVLAPLARAQGQGPGSALRVDFRVDGASDLRLLERLRGQTSDLPVALSEYAPTAPPGDFAQTVTAAFVRCRASGTDVVVWAAPAPPASSTASWVVAVATCHDGKVLARRLTTSRPARAGVDAASGALEAAALVLRGALSVLAEGGTLGVVPRGTASGDAPALVSPSPADAATGTLAAPAAAAPAGSGSARTVRSPASAGDDAASVAEPAPAPTRARSESAVSIAVPRGRSGYTQRERYRSRLDELALLGWEHSWIGAGSAGHSALTGTLALGQRRFRLGVTGSFGFPTSYRDRYTTIELARHVLAATWRQGVWRSAAWSLTAGLDVGCAFYRRTTQARERAVQAREAELSQALQLSLWSAVARRFGPIWMSLVAALEVLPFVPRFVYRAGSERPPALRVWPVAPRLAVAIGLGRQ